MFRLHIDIPLGMNEEETIRLSETILDCLQGLADTGHTVQYRLGNDTDRQTSNYFKKTDSGHVSNKKLTMISNILIDKELDKP
jgi:hypothetical protein